MRVCAIQAVDEAAAASTISLDYDNRRECLSAAESLDLWEMAAQGFENQLTLRPDDPPWFVADPDAKPGLDPQHNR